MAWAQLGLGSAWPGSWLRPLAFFPHTHLTEEQRGERVSFGTRWRAFLFKGCSSFVFEAGVDNESANEPLASPPYFKTRSTVGRVRRSGVSRPKLRCLSVLGTLLPKCQSSEPTKIYFTFDARPLCSLKRICLFALTK